MRSLIRAFHALPDDKNPALIHRWSFRRQASLWCVAQSVTHYLCAPSFAPSTPCLTTKILRSFIAGLFAARHRCGALLNRSRIIYALPHSRLPRLA
ncbi:hypothetical protein [Candidatus Spongiihabitans sp.]|uniref:hypothetical protein n=1 Tax=Candidatus Spongiihabitans sp. TaxID=3101308 RepID=UPI003C7CED2F